ncbi:hypothetical protein INT47_007872 [Mucor saturninus]|uniref:DUF6570 domain-containing protein n=1 Tax=Mucor saturninus TaxID=64648 RepID=A0A8H7QKL0_9FUNG|nr:hypothetical protein INT47_007872 [Mucor saturninus]
MSLALLTAQEKAERRREKNKLAQRKYQLRLRQQRIEEKKIQKTRRIRGMNNLLKCKQRDSFTPEENEAHRARMRQYVHNRAQNDPLFMEAEAQRARRNHVESGDEDGDDDRSERPNRRRLNCEKIAWERVRKEWAVPSQVNTINTTNVNTTARFCDLCRDKIKQNFRPALALADGLDFPETHCRLDDLPRLEERLVAGRHVFQSIWTLHGNSGQYRSKDGIVNVPVNVDTSVSALLRQLDDSFIIHLGLARRVRYLKDYIKGNIFTAKVRIAAIFLQTQPLYIKHEIELDDTWMESVIVKTNYVVTDSGISENEAPTNNTKENQNNNDNEAEVEEEKDDDDDEIEKVDQENGNPETQNDQEDTEPNLGCNKTATISDNSQPANVSLRMVPDLEMNTDNQNVFYLNDTTYTVQEPLPVFPINGYKTAEEVVNVIKEYGIRNNFATIIKKKESNHTHKRVHVACKYSGAPDKRTLGANSKRLHATFKKNCPYIVKASFTKKIGGYKIVNADVPGDLVHNCGNR